MQTIRNKFLKIDSGSKLFLLTGFICNIFHAILIVVLAFNPLLNTNIFYNNFIIFEVSVIALVSVFYSNKTNENPNIQNKLKFSLFYLCGYILGTIILILGIIATIIGILFLMFYISTNNTEILTDFCIDSILRFFYALTTIFVSINFVFSFKKLIICIKTEKICLREIIKPFLLILIIPIAFFVYNFLNLTLKQIITEPEFYLSTQNHNRTQQIFLQKGSTNCLIPTFLYNTPEGEENIEFYDFKSNKKYTTPKPTDININPILLPDKNILFIGGQTYKRGEATFKKEVYLFDYNQKTLNRVGDLKAPLYFPQILNLPNSKILLLDSKNKTSQLFDLKNKKFELAGKSYLQIEPIRGLVLKNNRVLIYGIYRYSKNDYKIKTQLYNIKSNKFIPIKNQSVAYKTFTPIMLSNGNVLIIGTRIIKTKELYSNRHQKAIQTVEIYNSTANEFLQVKNKPYIERVGPRLTLLKNGQVLITGGKDTVKLSGQERKRNFINEAEIFNPETQSFKLIGSRRKRLYDDFQGDVEYSLPNGNVLFIGGTEGRAECMKTSKKIEMFNIKTNKFKIIGNMRKARTNLFIIDSGNKIILYDGESNNHSLKSPSAEILELSRLK